MAVKPVLKMGDPRLRQVCEPVREFGTQALRELVTDMFDTMRAENGAGLAAIQIGVPLRVVIFGFEHNSRYPECPPIPETVLINPEIEPLSDEMATGWEGCLSIPGLRGLVPRYTHIRYRGFDPAGEPLEVEARDFHARVIQHECDHLDGILYPQRMTDLTTLGFVEALEAAGAMDTGAQPCEDERDSVV